MNLWDDAIAHRAAELRATGCAVVRLVAWPCSSGAHRSLVYEDAAGIVRQERMRSDGTFEMVEASDETRAGFLRTRERRRSVMVEATRPVKTCACGCSYDDAAWERLVLVGYQIVLRADEDVPGELRNCVCGSTLTVPVPLERVCAVARDTPDRVHGSAARTAIELLTVENAGLRRKLEEKENGDG